MRYFLLVLLLAGSVQAQNPKEGFDVPLKTTVKDFGPSPYYPQERKVRKRLTCHFYPTLTIKEYDDGQKGAEWSSVVPSAQAACTLKHAPNEKTLNDWHGYFRGIKDQLVFYDAADGTDGGMPFEVFDVRTGKKLFEDSSALDYYLKANKDSAFKITVGKDGIPKLTYLRVVRAGCNLGTPNCWDTARVKFGIIQTKSPACSRYVHRSKQLRHCDSLRKCADCGLTP